MTEADVREEYINPALKAAGWGVVADSHIRREYKITEGRKLGNGRRDKKLQADYVLFYRNQMLAVVEAKAWDKELSEGVQQAKDYAEKLDIRFTYSSNGRGFYGIDMFSAREAEFGLDAFPTPDELWHRLGRRENVWIDRFNEIPFNDRGGSHPLRYYQYLAVNRVLEAIADGRDRILLTLATGTGKTFIAFQIAWKLFKSHWNLRDREQPGEQPRLPHILFLADRNILADQAFNAFSSFEDKALARISPAEIRKRGQVPKNASIFFTIFQTFTAGNSANPDAELDREGVNNTQGHFGEYARDFFDLIIVDECHRGGARDESSWREILEYFSPAVQLGMTATPKRRDNVDTYSYFGEPVYSYSLKDGINDGFLTPFKVHEFSTTLDDYVFTPDDEVLEGEIEEGRRYEEKDFNSIIEIRERERQRVSLMLDYMNQKEKTLVFCANQIHALVIRDLINQLKQIRDPNYCHRVTADEGRIGDEHLRDFQDNEKSIPTILTTSQKLSTGVDARNVRNIVLLRPVNSMIEFKQIIGRGTRLFDGKDYFTIYDFVRAHRHFNDPEWDGEPLAPEPAELYIENEPPAPPHIREASGDYNGDRQRRQKVKVRLADGKERNLQHMMRTSLWNANGTPMSAQEFMEELFGMLPDFFQDEAELRKIWSRPDTRKKLLQGLEEKNIGMEQLREMRRIIDAEDCDMFDVLAHVAYALPPLSRENRATSAKQFVYHKFDSKQQVFLDFVLDQYVNIGVEQLDRENLQGLLELRYGSIEDAKSELGQAGQIGSMFAEFQGSLYRPRS